MSEDLDDFVVPCYRPIHPPQRVWIKASKAWPLAPGQAYENRPDGAQLAFEVLGGLTGQVLRADGGWLAEVAFQLHSANGKWHSRLYRDQLIPSYLLRRDRYGNSYRSDPYEDDGLPH